LLKSLIKKAWQQVIELPVQVAGMLPDDKASTLPILTLRGAHAL